MPRLTEKEVRLLVSDLETGRGYATQVAGRHPWLTRESEGFLRDSCGDQFPVFRTVSLVGSEEPGAELVVSTTLRPTYALRLALDAPGMIFGAGRMQPYLLRYELAAERTILYMPLVISVLREGYGSLLDKIRIDTRHGERLSGRDVLDAVERLDEQEVLADVDGLRPSVMALPQHVAGREAWWSLIREPDSPLWSDLRFDLSRQLVLEYEAFIAPRES